MGPSFSRDRPDFKPADSASSAGAGSWSPHGSRCG